MAGGYFTDGIINSNILLAPHDLPAEVLPSGGGIQEIEVQGQRLRFNLGDAERYVYEIFAALATSDPGVLGVEDVLDRRATFGEAVCVAAVGEIYAFTFADMRFTFLAGEKSGEPAWGAIPSAPGVYAGTSTSQDYAAGGVSVGTYPEKMRIEMRRRCNVRVIPRARGARATVPHSGAHIRFTITGHEVADVNNLAVDLQALARQIGPGAVNLTGNGNTYTDCVLQGLRTVFTDNRATRFQAGFVKEL